MITNKDIAEGIADNKFFRMAFANLKKKRIPLNIGNLFTEAYRLLNFVEKHKIKIGAR